MSGNNKHIWKAQRRVNISEMPIKDISVLDLICALRTHRRAHCVETPERIIGEYRPMLML